MEPTLEVFLRDRVVFSSTAKWLHPLFEFEDYLAAERPPVGELFLRDKVIGRAAAMLVHRLGIRRLHACLLSRLAEDFLAATGMTVTHDVLVDRIDCITEDLLERETDVEAAWRMLKERAQKAKHRHDP
jgi:zinc transport system ATP-binding protein